MCGIILNLGQLRCCYFFIFSSGGHFAWRSLIVSLNVGKGPYEEHLGEIILNMDKQIGRCGIKDFSIFRSGGHFVCAILVEGLMRNI